MPVLVGFSVVQVLGADLNCSESRRRAACPSMMPAQSPDFTYSCQASTEHFQQCAEFPLLRNRGLGAIAMTVLAISLTRRGTATACAAVQSTARFFRCWRPAGLPALGPRSVVAGDRQGLPLLVRAPHGRALLRGHSELD